MDVHIRRLFRQGRKALALAGEKTERHAMVCVSAECGHSHVMMLSCCMICYHSMTRWLRAGTVRRYLARKKSSGMSAFLHPLPRPLQNNPYRCKSACSVLLSLLVPPAEGLERCAISLSDTLHAHVCARAHAHTPGLRKRAAAQSCTPAIREQPRATYFVSFLHRYCQSCGSIEHPGSQERARVCVQIFPLLSGCGMVYSL